MPSTSSSTSREGTVGVLEDLGDLRLHVDEGRAAELDGGGQLVEASVRIPNGFAPITTDRVRVVSPRHPSAVDDWQVTSEGFSEQHERLMLRRLTG
jgi:hypothetical protein